MNPSDRTRFDLLLDGVVEALPAGIAGLFDEKPIIVEDQPSDELLEELGIPLEARSELCGLHSGAMLSEQSVESFGGDLTAIHLFREGIVAVAGGWDAPNEAIEDEIEITLLHEIGHHFGLDEEDLAALGYD